jgi:hypothetical protein
MSFPSVPEENSFSFSEVQFTNEAVGKAIGFSALIFSLTPPEGLCYQQIKQNVKPVGALEACAVCFNPGRKPANSLGSIPAIIKKERGKISPICQHPQ